MPNLSKIFHINNGTVKRDITNRGIGAELLKANMGLAKSLGYKVAKAECSSIFSKRALETEGFNVEAEIFYDKVEHKGRKLFKNMNTDLHPSCALMVKTL